MDEKIYNDLIESFLAMHHSVQTSGFSNDAFKPGLERMFDFDRALGISFDGQDKAFRTIHVAGTNGKGSVSSMLAAALAGSGLKVGLYTSPHLIDLRERIKIIRDGHFSMIPKESVCSFLLQNKTVIDNLALTFFELTTGMAFWWFKECKVDIAIIEAGLGGRLDSTNVIVPDLSIITSIGLDHCAILGSTRQAIAIEKAGIIKKGVSVLIGEKDDETSPVFEKEASRQESPLFYARPHPQIPGLDLRGEYQHRNTDTVLTALEILNAGIDTEAIKHTAAATGLQGRWECLDKSLAFPKDGRVHSIADIGHNPPALRWNIRQLEEMMETGQYDRLVILYGVMADKAIDDIIPIMPGCSSKAAFPVHYIFTTPSTPRALRAETVYQKFKEKGADIDMQSIDNVQEALTKAQTLTGSNGLLYIGGSAFLVADVLLTLKKNQ